MKIVSYTYEDYLEKVRAFHGDTAPGVVLGGVMVSEARLRLPGDILYDAVSETDKCLPDAIQLLTPCTTGNGWMRIINSGRFALCLYNKTTGDGIRVAVDPLKIKDFPELNTWFFVLKPKKEQDKERILSGIENSGRGILTVSQVKVDIQALSSKYEDRYAICLECRESYPVNNQGLCLVCQGKASYCL